MLQSFVNYLAKFMHARIRVTAEMSRFGNVAFVKRELSSHLNFSHESRMPYNVTVLAPPAAFTPAV